MGAFFFLDAARAGRRFQEVPMVEGEMLSLYEGIERQQLTEVAPYLCRVPDDGEFKDWIFDNGWGRAWGYFLWSEVSFSALLAHFRKFLFSKDENGAEYYFRFYDPRVLKTYITGRDGKYLSEFFGPVEYFMAEGVRREEAIVFRHRQGDLLQTRISVADASGHVSFALNDKQWATIS